MEDLEPYVVALVRAVEDDGDVDGAERALVRAGADPDVVAHLRRTLVQAKADRTRK